jgi:DNA-binding transcriptional ArsR family regulator
MVAEAGPSRSVARVRVARAAQLGADAAHLLAQVRSALCESTRAQIVRALCTGPLTVTELCQVLERSKWTTSQHLRVLRREGLVTPRRRGRSVIYSVADHPGAHSAREVLDLIAQAA